MNLNTSGKAVASRIAAAAARPLRIAAHAALWIGQRWPRTQKAANPALRACAQAAGRLLEAAIDLKPRRTPQGSNQKAG